MPETEIENTVPAIAVRLDRAHYDVLREASERLHIPLAVITRSVISRAIEAGDVLFEDRRTADRTDV